MRLYLGRETPADEFTFHGFLEQELIYYGTEGSGGCLDRYRVRAEEQKGWGGGVRGGSPNHK